MLRDKELRVSLAPKTKASTEYQPIVQTQDDNTITIVTESVKDVMNEGLKLVAIYVAMDTARKVLLTLLTK